MEFLFDVTIDATVAVDAKSERAAREALHGLRMETCPGRTLITGIDQHTTRFRLAERQPEPREAAS
jgi:hypothetical protein